MKNIISRRVPLINENFMQLQETSSNTMSVGVLFPQKDLLCRDVLRSWVKSKTALQSQQTPPFEEGIWGNFKPFVSSQDSKST